MTKVHAGRRFVVAEAKVAEVNFMPAMYKFCATVPLHACVGTVHNNQRVS